MGRRAWDRCLRDAFRGKRLVECAVGTAIAFPALFNRVAAVFARRRGMADLLVGVTGDFIPAREVLRPGFLFTLLLAPASFADAPPGSPALR